MSKVGQNPYVRVTPASSKGDSKNQGQGQGKNQGQGQGQGQGQKGHSTTDSFEVHKKTAVNWTAAQATPDSSVYIRGNVRGDEKGNATLKITHNLPDGSTRQINSTQTPIIEGGIVDASVAVKVGKPEGTVSFEIKTENNTYKGSDLLLTKGEIKG